MITDASLQLASAQAITASAASQNTFDLGVARDPGAGENLYIVVTVDQAAAAAGAATVNFQFVSSSASNLGASTVLAQTGPIPKADLTPGRSPIVLRVPRHALTSQPIGQRYVALNFNVNNGPLTAGQFTASITHDVQDINRPYGSGYSAA